MASIRKFSTKPPEVDWAHSAQFASALDEAAIVAVTDTAGRILYCNDRFCEVSGYSREELIGSTHRLIGSGLHDRAFFQGVFATITSGKVWRGAICNRRKSGSVYWVDTTIVPQFDAQGAISAYVAIRFDVTGHIQALQDLVEAQKRAERASEAKDRFVANMSHEIRTPLNGVVGVAGALARTRLEPRQAEMVELIASSGRSLERILNDILDLSKVEAGRLELELAPFDLQAEIRAAAHLMGVRADDQGLVFSVDFAPGAEGAFLGDATRLKQIVTNLTSNAVKFTPSGFVAVFVRVDGAEAPGQDGDLHVEVRDSGVGFDMDQSPFLFERFAQADNSMSRRYGGAGLGLSICKGLAELMGGDISARSHPGQGSVFRLRVPVRRLNVVAEIAPAVGDGLAAAERRLRILLAEDHPMNQKVVGLLLEPFGVDLVVAHDGAEAIRLFEDESFDLILMDMQMPVTDGLAATLAIRRIEAAEGRAPIPIAMMTANTSDDHRAQAAAAGADGFISKPVTSESLLTGNDNLLALAPARCGAAAS